MRTIFEWFGYIALFIVLAFRIFLYLVEFWCFIKCFKAMKFNKCFNRKCKFHAYCFRYEYLLTKEEIEELKNL